MPPARRLGLVLGITQMLAWATTYYVPAVATGAVADSFGVPAAAVLGGFSLALLVSGMLAPRVGRAIERSGGRPVLALGTLLQAAGLLVLSVSDGLPVWYAGWVVVGAGMSAGLYDAAFATAGRALGAEARPVITGITLIAGFASTVGWPAGAALIAALGWRPTLMCYAGVLLLVNLPALLLVPAAPPALPAPAAAAGRAGGGRLPFVAMAAFFTLRAAISAIVSVAMPALLAGLGLGTAQAIALAALIGPAQVGTRLLQATLGRGLSPLAVSWIGAGLLPAAALGLLALRGISLPAAALVFVLGYGVSNGILTIARGVLPLFLFGSGGYAVRIGQLALPVLLAQAAAPLLAAPLLDAWPAAAVLAGLGLLSLLAAACLAPLRPPRP